jgi:putative nucleotidyltransferase with HDIG domain
MFGNQKSSARRLAIRENRPDTSAIWFKELQCNGTFPSIAIAIVFWILASAILMMRQDVLPYRLGQTVRYDIFSRVDFNFVDSDLMKFKQEEARNSCDPVFVATGDPNSTGKKTGDAWQSLEDQLLALPDRVQGLSRGQLPADLADISASALFDLQTYQEHNQKKRYTDAVHAFIKEIRRQNWVLLKADERNQLLGDKRRTLTLVPSVNAQAGSTQEVSATYALPPGDDLRAQIRKLIEADFLPELGPKIEQITLAATQPTYIKDRDLSLLFANNAAAKLPQSEWTIEYQEGQPIVHKGQIQDRDLHVLRSENRAYNATLDSASGWKTKAGIAGVTLLLTIALSAYTAHFQPRVVANHLRGIAIAALLLSMLVVAEIAGLGTGQIYLLAIAPVLLVAMILSIAYEQRFAVGVTSIHAILVTIGLDQRIGFLVIIWIGLVFTTFMLNDIRSRSKLIEVGGVSAIAMMLACAAWGLMSLDSPDYILKNCLYAGAAGLSSGFVVLGTLPFIEKAFRITTSMTLLELADASHPLLRRLAIEAPGTYSHSLQVATLAEAAAEAIGANSLLCRVAAYYHDVGKINKPDYFVENQQQGQQNRHFNLTPSVSFLIIKGHVMDGVEMAREYTLPTSLFPFIQQHHGTTLVEHFYKAACSEQEKRGEDAAISDTEFRYPGPKPRSREVAILMLADAAESATRSMKEPTAGAIEALVNKLSKNRLLDGQFDDCDLTLRDLDRVEKSLIKTLLSIYHGRLSYPSTADVTSASSASSGSTVLKMPAQGSA